MSKWEENKWKIFWLWVVVAIYAVTMSILYKSERSKREELEGRLRHSDSVLYDCRQGKGVLSRRIAELFAYDTCVTLTDVEVVADYVWRLDCEKIGGALSVSSSDSVWCFRCTQPNKETQVR